MELLAIDIVLPCYNPTNAWYEELFKFHQAAQKHYSLNFILVNDGSSDSVTIERQLDLIRSRNISIQYISYEKNMGKGYALRQGVLATKNNHVIYTDIDFPFTDDSTLRLMAELAAGTSDVVVGYRAENYYRKTMSAYRKILSQTFRFFLKRILRMSVTDTQCGLKGFNQKGKIKFLKTTVNRYLFDFEFIYTSGKDPSLVMSTLEVRLKDNIVFSKMRLKILVQEIFNLLRVLMFRKS